MKLSEWELAGTFGVDAGLCWVGDPCYCVTPDADEHPSQTWLEFCDLLDKENGMNKNGYQSFNYKMGHEGLGVCVRTGYGDGSYPVYVKKNNEGRIMRVLIKFD